MIIIFAYFYLICIYLFNYSASISYGLFVLIVYYKDLNVYCWFLVNLLNLYIMMHIIIECFCTNKSYVLFYVWIYSQTCIKRFFFWLFNTDDLLKKVQVIWNFLYRWLLHRGDHMTRFIYSSFNFLLNWITNSH